MSRKNVINCVPSQLRILISPGEEKKFIGGEQKESSGKLVDNCKSTNCSYFFSLSLYQRSHHIRILFGRKNQPCVSWLIPLFRFFYRSHKIQDLLVEAKYFSRVGMFPFQFGVLSFCGGACQLKSLATNKSVSTLRPTFLNTGWQQHQNRPPTIHQIARTW